MDIESVSNLPSAETHFYTVRSEGWLVVLMDDFHPGGTPYKRFPDRALAISTAINMAAADRLPFKFGKVDWGTDWDLPQMARHLVFTPVETIHKIRAMSEEALETLLLLKRAEVETAAWVLEGMMGGGE